MDEERCCVEERASVQKVCRSHSYTSLTAFDMGKFSLCITFPSTSKYIGAAILLKHQYQLYVKDMLTWNHVV